jgi:hypothetical protein
MVEVSPRQGETGTVMLLSTWESLDLAGTPRNPWGELRLISRLLQEAHRVTAPAELAVIRPALARAA